MTNARALDRVNRDLAAGQPRAAVRRLRAMLSKDSTDLGTYRLLARIHRQLGDVEEAGRWGYLTDEVTPEEISAFERAHPQPQIRLQLLGWSGDLEALDSAGARARLARLREQVANATIPTQRHQNADTGGRASRPVIPGQRRPSSDPLRLSETPQAGFAGPVSETPRAAFAKPVSETPQAGFARRVGVTRRPAGSPFRTYAMLALLIIGGSIGSLIAVAGIRALFGVENWFAPVETLVSTIARALTD